MAKTKHNRLLDTIHRIVDDATRRGTANLTMDGDGYTARTLRIDERELLHFGTTSYLGLGVDPRLKAAAIEAIETYGTQFPLSRTFLSFALCRQLEERLQQMYRRPVQVTKNSSLAHLGAVPSLVHDDDLVLLDHQVHASVQNACQLVRARGVPVEILRHNDMELLARRVAAGTGTHRRVWYFCDGVYSMYGDTAPLPEILSLLRRNERFWAYIDDVHGMSWAGRHGAGWVMERVGELPEQVVLATTLGKSFGANGGLLVFPDQATHDALRLFGGALTFTAQLDPASVAAAAESARIHLSDEIVERQQDLAAKIDLFQSLLDDRGIPCAARNRCPLFFVPCGSPAVAFGLVHSLMEEGFYTNPATFPAVPIKKAGVRISITGLHDATDIADLAAALAELYPRALAAEGRRESSVRQLFALPEKPTMPPESAAANMRESSSEPGQRSPGEGELRVERHRSIHALDATAWNRAFRDRGFFDAEGLAGVEALFTDPERLGEHVWEVFYLVVKRGERWLAASFFVHTLAKDDMLAPARVSRRIEAERAERGDAHFMTSKLLMMGSLLSDGEHLFLDRDDPAWRDALDRLIGEAEALRRELGAAALMLRDFPADDIELRDLFLAAGYLPVDVPNFNVVESLDWTSADDLAQRLGRNARRSFRRRVVQRLDAYEVTIRPTLAGAEAEHAHALYRRVWERNVAINLFPYPAELFEMPTERDRWEFFCLHLRAESGGPGSERPVAVGLCYRGDRAYVPVTLGLDYTFQAEHFVYQQVLFRVVEHARDQGFERVLLGFSADLEKRRVGAVQRPRVAYVQAHDNYRLERVEMF